MGLEDYILTFDSCFGVEFRESSGLGVSTWKSNGTLYKSNRVPALSLTSSELVSKSFLGSEPLLPY